MILSFISKKTEKVWNGERVKKWPVEIQTVGRRKLRMLNNSQNITDLRIPQTRISEILKKNRRITAETALRLSKYFGTTPKFWLGLQDDFDIEEELKSKTEKLATIKKLTNLARLKNQFRFRAGSHSPSYRLRFSYSNNQNLLPHTMGVAPLYNSSLRGGDKLPNGS